MLTLNTMRATPGATHYTKRLGRGAGSGHGQTSGKGHKGQLARSGGVSRPGFEGGQTPLYRRLPKRGFNNFSFQRKNAIVNLTQLDTFSGKEISLESLLEKGMLRGQFDRLIVLGNGDLKKAINVKAYRVSDAAKAKIEKAGGKVEILPVLGMNGKKKPKKQLNKDSKK